MRQLWPCRAGEGLLYSICGLSAHHGHDNRNPSTQRWSPSTTPSRAPPSAAQRAGWTWMVVVPQLDLSSVTIKLLHRKEQHGLRPLSMRWRIRHPSPPQWVQYVVTGGGELRRSTCHPGSMLDGLQERRRA